MPIVDGVVQKSIESVGYSPVVVLRKCAPPDDCQQSHSRAKTTQDIPEIFLKELPDAAGINRVMKLATKNGMSVSAALNAPEMEVRRPMQAPEPLSLQQLGMECGFLDATGLDTLSGNNSVEAIISEASLPLQLIRTGELKNVPDPGSRNSWVMERLNVNYLRKQGLSGKGIGVAHLDTGVDVSHPDLSGRVTKFMEIDEHGRRARGTLTVRDTHNHGTMTAGLICGGEISGSELGMAPGTELFSCVVLEGSDPLKKVVAGIEWILELQRNGDPVNVRVLNMSLGLPGIDPDNTADPTIIFMKRLIDSCLDAGILPVVAIGNDGPGRCCTPGNFANVLSVGSVDRDDRVMDKSASGSYDRDINPYVPTVVAPGDEGVILAKAGGGYTTTHGTSLSAALVSGIAALLFEANPNATPGQVAEAIRRSGKHLKDDSPLRSGYGMIDARIALELVRQFKSKPR